MSHRRGTPQSGEPLSRQAVRVGHLPGVSKAIQGEMGQKVVWMLNEYHEKIVMPELRWLRLPWELRALIAIGRTVRDWALGAWRFLRPAKTSVPEPVPEPADDVGPNPVVER